MIDTRKTFIINSGMAKKQKTPEDFWREYEEKIGTKVIAYGLGQYVSGWEEFDSRREGQIWGLIIAAANGFRFHHFPQENWMSAIVRLGSPLNDPPKEKIIFIPAEKIINAVHHRETKWYRKIFAPANPRLVIHYHDETGTERELLFFAEYKPNGVAEALAKQLASG